MASTSKTTQPIEQQLNPDTQPETLNYEAIKKQYFELVEKNADLLKLSVCTRKGIEQRIAEIKNDPRSAGGLEVRNAGGKDRLYIKRNEIISVEDAFDIVLIEHLKSNHSDAATMYAILSRSYSFPKHCVTWVVASCTACMAISTIETPVNTEFPQTGTNNLTGRGIWRINIIRRDDVLVKNPRSAICYLLIFKEDSTNFVILRPLCESSEELGLEVFKLCTEFGYPEKVYVPNMINFYSKIFQMVHLINPAADTVPVQKATDVDIFLKDKDEVFNELRNWMEMMDDTYWEQFCHIVQYKLNTTEKLLTRMFSKTEKFGIPFNLFFQYRFRTKMTWIELPFNKRNKEEE